MEMRMLGSDVAEEAGRVLVTPEIFERLTREAERRGTTPSKLADHVFSGFLGEMERVIYGRVGETAVVSRDTDAVGEHGVRIDALVVHVGALVKNMDTMTQLAAVHLLQETYSVKIPIHVFKEIIASPTSLSTIISSHLPAPLAEQKGHKKLLQECASVFRKFYSERKSLGPILGARDMCLRVSQMGCKVAVVGDCAQEFLQAALDGLGMSDGQRPVVSAAVAKELYQEMESETTVSFKHRLLRAAQLIDLPLSRCAYVDINAANLAVAGSLGMRVIGVADEPFPAPVAVTRPSAALVTFEDILGHQVPYHESGESDEEGCLEQDDSAPVHSTASFTEFDDAQQPAGDEARGLVEHQPTNGTDSSTKAN